MAGEPEWRRLAYVKSDSVWKRRYRELQSWYREQRLGLDAGIGFGRRLGNWLPEGSGDRNFLDSSIARYARQRLRKVRAEGGTIHEDRLFRNMLSSMPLCFNLFGFLREHPEEAALALKKETGLDVVDVERIEVEWASSPAPLDDKTAFDSFVEFRTGAGERGFLGVETKYTEPFGSQKLDLAKYQRVAREVGALSDASPAVPERLTRQHWRNLILAAAVSQRENYVVGASVIASCSDDRGAERAVTELQEHAAFPVVHLAYERLIEALEALPETGGWAASFRERYLDLTPIRESV